MRLDSALAGVLEAPDRIAIGSGARRGQGGLGLAPPLPQLQGYGMGGSSRTLVRAAAAAAARRQGARRRAAPRLPARGRSAKQRAPRACTTNRMHAHMHSTRSTRTRHPNHTHPVAPAVERFLVAPLDAGALPTDAQRDALAALYRLVQQRYAPPLLSGTALLRRLEASLLLPTGCAPIDQQLLRGGLRQGQLTEVCGDTGGCGVQGGGGVGWLAWCLRGWVGARGACAR